MRRGGGSGGQGGTYRFVTANATATATATWTFTPTTSVVASIFFETGGGDNVGPILDNVSLAAVAQPKFTPVFMAGLQFRL